jgi:hypothetical protein
MINNTFPFFAGQRTDKAFGSSSVLSPLPIKTMVPKVKSCDILVNKTDAYIELGGAGGMIFQTQAMWMIFLIGFFIGFLPLYIAFDGFTGLYLDSYKDVLVNGEWVVQFQSVDFFLKLFGILAPFGGILFILFKGVQSTHRKLNRTLPFRFHRQRRAVMMSRWNEETKQTEIKMFPWEEICAMVGQGSAMSTGGIISSASLVIAANDSEDYGHFWSSMQTGAMNKIHAAGMWEMIRSFMEEGPEAIGEPSPLTLEGLIEQHCASRDMKVEDFTTATKVWWYLNGTMLGIWRINYETQKMKQNADTFTEVTEWSRPLPKAQWAKPSDALQYYNNMLAENEYAKGQTIFSIGDIRQKYGDVR